ncbi:MAG: HTH domain-containing protein [Thermoanaerobaculia bacterium]|nr:HTH domain-containing protein [Thermoanaerobaculia bacterium]
MLPKTGKRFPDGSDREHGGSGYAEIVAGALAKELGDTHRAAKVLMGWTGAGERTVKHWLAGLHGPTGEHLLVLMRESEAVFEAVLAAIDRSDAAVAARMLAARRSLREAASLVQREQRRPSAADEPAVSRQQSEAARGPNDRENDRNRDRNRGRDHDRDPGHEDDLDFETRNRRRGGSVGDRRTWFLERLRAGADIGATDIMERWSVSEKSARRDIAALKAAGTVKFVGSPRSGRYRATH